MCDTGHFVLEDKADEVVPLIRDFLKRKVPPIDRSGPGADTRAGFPFRALQIHLFRHDRNERAVPSSLSETDRTRIVLDLVLEETWGRDAKGRKLPQRAQLRIKRHSDGVNIRDNKTDGSMMEVWEKSIKPTLFDYGDQAAGLVRTPPARTRTISSITSAPTRSTASASSMPPRRTIRYSQSASRTKSPTLG